jgi:hypothetical protein
MNSNRTKLWLGFSLFLGVLAFAAGSIQTGSAQSSVFHDSHHSDLQTTCQDPCGKTWTSEIEEVSVDDVLDDPDKYVGRLVTLEGEIDHIRSGSTFVMEDDQDLFGEDHLLIVSIMSGVTADGEMEEGKLVRATGVIRYFDRAGLEREFGTLDLGIDSLDEFANQPVLVMGTREYAAAHQPQQTAAVIEPAPLEPPAFVPEPFVEPAPIPEPEKVEPPPPVYLKPEEVLPTTGSPLPGVGLAGALSLLLGFALRRFR